MLVRSLEEFNPKLARGGQGGASRGFCPAQDSNSQRTRFLQQYSSFCGGSQGSWGFVPSALAPTSLPSEDTGVLVGVQLVGVNMWCVLCAWAQITSDAWVLEVVCEGYSLEFAWSLAFSRWMSIHKQGCAGDTWTVVAARDGDPGSKDRVGSRPVFHLPFAAQVRKDPGPEGSRPELTGFLVST